MRAALMQDFDKNDAVRRFAQLLCKLLVDMVTVDAE
jgi:hypothetical protein